MASSRSMPGFDADALLAQFESASAEQARQLRKATTQAMLAALRGRELTLANARKAVQQVADAAGAGAARNSKVPELQPLLDAALGGIDDALLKAVDAHRVALQQLQAQGADLGALPLKKALADLDKFEDTLFAALDKAGQGLQGPAMQAWDQALNQLQAAGSATGGQAAQAAQMLRQATEQALAQGRQLQGAMRDGRAASMRAAQALADSYTAMVSGVLIGLSDALRGGTGGGAAPREGGAEMKPPPTKKSAPKRKPAG